MEAERMQAGTPRRYDITEECNGCGVCAEWAPNNIVLSWDGSYCEVVQQPTTPREEWDLHDAEMACPLACLRVTAARDGIVRARPLALGTSRST
jgi:ferredoxin